jgi:hypothetical protein
MTGEGATRRPKPPVPFYYWPLWMFLLAVGLFVFYVVFTPAWMAIRLAAWASERSRRGPAPPTAAV